VTLTLVDAAEALRAGLVVGVPTDTVYGLAVDPRVRGAAARLFAAKGRPETVALPVLVAAAGDAEELSGGLPPPAARLAAAYWPGPLTIVLRRAAASTDLELGGDPATVGVRCPGHLLVLELLGLTGPLAVTSANRHGDPPLTEAAGVVCAFGAAIAGVLDGGRCDGTPSTVVRVAGDGIELLRAGAIDFADLVVAAAAA
jgi:L-threonylcarbamoyladenylate synthase